MSKIKIKLLTEALEKMTKKKVVLKEYFDDEEEDENGTWDEEVEFEGHTIKNRLVDDGDIEGEIDDIPFFVSATIARGPNFTIPNFGNDDVSVDCKDKELGEVVHRYEMAQRSGKLDEKKSKKIKALISLLEKNTGKNVVLKETGSGMGGFGRGMGSNKPYNNPNKVPTTNISQAIDRFITSNNLKTSAKRDIQKEWNAVKEDYGGDITKYLNELEERGDYDIWLDNEQF